VFNSAKKHFLKLNKPDALIQRNSTLWPEHGRC
jgi:hypothetical protein